jgi:hypothetical protein
MKLLTLNLVFFAIAFGRLMFLSCSGKQGCLKAQRFQKETRTQTNKAAGRFQTEKSSTDHRALSNNFLLKDCLESLSPQSPSISKEEECHLMIVSCPTTGAMCRGVREVSLFPREWSSIVVHHPTPTGGSGNAPRAFHKASQSQKKMRS